MPNALYRKKTGSTQKKRLNVSKEYLDESIILFEDMAVKLSKNLKNKFKS
jgi:hypothetical protein